MAKAQRLEDTLAELHQLRADPTSESALATLRRVLGGKLSHAVAKAAQIAGEFEIAELTPELATAFDRFMINPVKTDPGCRAKAQIAEALYRIGYEDADLFLRGIRHVQPEPVYGGKADTAGALRSACAFGLVRARYSDVMIEVADLFADRESPVRIAAVRAIAYSERDDGVPLLRLKVLTGDEPEVISECLSALLQIAPSSSLPFVARLLDAPDAALQEMAALALGGSRLPDAFDIVHAWWDRTSAPDLRRTALLAIAMLKHDRPLDFLLSLIAEAAGPTARDAIAALGLYKHDDALRQRVRRAAARDDVDLRAAVADAFER